MNSFEIEIGWALGLALGTVRAGTFVAAGGLIPRSVPRTVRATPAIAFGVLIGQPIDTTANLAELLVLVVMNAFLGAVLGWVLGLATQPFMIAGQILDIASGLMVASLFDPESGTTPGAVSKFMDTAGRTLLIVAGGLGVAAKVLHASVQAVALDGSLQAYAIVGPTATRSVARVVRAGLELALPVLAVLFLIELTMGMVSRVAPQADAFLLGMPIKLFTTFLLLGSLIVVFPATADRALAEALATVRDLLRSFAG